MSNANQNPGNGNRTAAMNNLTDVVNKMTLEGYTVNFKVNNQGLHSEEHDKTYSPEEVHIINFYRFEGPSDPADNSILYVIETNDGLKGQLIDAYGPYADHKVNAFIQQVEDINKKVDKK